MYGWFFFVTGQSVIVRVILQLSEHMAEFI